MNASRSSLPTGLVVLLLLALPLLGAWAAGRELAPLFRFPPPLDIPTHYPHFSWWAAGAVLASLVIFMAPWVGAATADARQAPAQPPVRSKTAFPWWGWAAVAWTLSWWILAWTRLAWFETFQRFTFFPLWFGFIVMFNALTFRRVGTCLMLRFPSRWLALFGGSAVFWWAFEWLNRFVRNWHYLAVDDFGPRGYAFNATLCFSTVLPAVAAVAEWLSSHRRWIAYAAAGPVWRGLARTPAALSLFAGGAVALVLTGAFPTWTYPALWLAPLALLLGESVLSRRGGVFAEVARGDWTRTATWMIAALICGFFWELWNWHSLAKWVYTVPGVERWHLFEMPALGYAGYLPFGLECLLVAERLIGRAWTSD